MRSTRTLWLAIAAAVALALSGPTQAGLVGYWNFDETGGTVAGDASSNGAYGVVQGSARVAGKFGGAYNFDGNDQVLIADVASKFASIDDQVTIAFWQYGAASQPRNDTIFGGQKGGQRIFNVHLPWGNGNVYWDAGYDGGYDRINKGGTTPDQYKGDWNHWAFTKDTATGQMEIYHNGSPWHSGGGKTRSMAGTETFAIGSDVHKTYYQGQVDEFAIWNEALSPAAIASLAAATQAMTIDAATITSSLTNSGGSLSPGGDGAIGTTTIAPGPQNVAPGGTASQSSLGHGLGTPEKAIDDNTDGQYFNGSVTHTSSGDTDSWWQVALGGDVDIDEITLYNRADCCGIRLSNFRVSLFDGGTGGTEVFGQDFYVGSGSVPQGGSLAINLPDGSVGDTVQVQLLGKNNEGTGVLSLAEVMAFSIQPTDYTQLLDGILSIELDALNGTADKLIVSGALTLGGLLDVTLLNGTLEPGDTFDILDWGSLSGSFDAINLPEHAMAWDVSLLYETGEIHLTPEPTTLALVALGGLALVRRRRR